MPTAPAGDLLKTAEIVAEERKRSPNTKATLVLTTNQEPGVELCRDVNAFATGAGIEIDMWSRSRLASVLDNDPRGQWLRKRYLGIEQVLLSEELLRELSRVSLGLYKPPDRPEAWVDRTLDSDIKRERDSRIIFLIGESGIGKSVACYKRLLGNLASDGFSLVLPPEVIEASLSLENAVEKTLMQLKPTLNLGCGAAAFQLSRPGRRILLAIEDINRSSRGTNLLEKIARWDTGDNNEKEPVSWQLLCPVWPQMVSALSEEARRRIGERYIRGTSFNAYEGAEAVRVRRTEDGHSITKLEAERISEALGHDPLLIALQKPEKAPDASRTISDFVDSCLARLAGTAEEFTRDEYRNTLLELASGMLLRRQLEPSFIDAIKWPEVASMAGALRQLVHQGEVIRLTDRQGSERISFRHDRVRELLLSRAAFVFFCKKEVPIDLLSEPYFAEIFGLALTAHDASSADAALMATHNPLALFCALRKFVDPSSLRANCVATAIKDWVVLNDLSAPQNVYLRWEVSRVLAETEAPVVPELVLLTDDGSWYGHRARYLNGDLEGGIRLCIETPPGVQVAGLKAFLDHVKSRFGAKLIKTLAEFLVAGSLDDSRRIGGLRLAGHIGEPALADAIRLCWRCDRNRSEHLREYLWACARCVDDEPASLLGPVCDEWSYLSDEPQRDGRLSPRAEILAYNLHIALRDGVPENSVRYFVKRGSDHELKEQVLTLLRGLDHPDALEFVVKSLAAMEEQQQGAGNFSSTFLAFNHHWQGKQERSGRAMSDRSRVKLLHTWRDEANGIYVRRQAFRLWSATCGDDDIQVLRAVSDSDALADHALCRRLELGDKKAIPGLLPKLTTRGRSWWQIGRYIWSDDLTIALDQALCRRRDAYLENGDSIDEDWILPEMIMRLPVNEAQTLLTNHWDHLYNSRGYILSALYIATPRLRHLVKTTIDATTEPRELLGHLGIHFGLWTEGRPGLTRPEQFEALVPYLQFLDESNTRQLWEECNRLGWLDLRREHLDPIIPRGKWLGVILENACVLRDLDIFLDNESPLIYTWLSHLLKVGFALDEVMILIGGWLADKGSIEALRLACDAVFYIGERRHVELLKSPNIEPRDIAIALIANTEFGVRRRTLN